MTILHELSELIKKRNVIDSDISKLIRRPSLIGHMGEFIASIIFDIKLNNSATMRGNDGYFNSGKLRGKQVNIKWYPKREGILDLNVEFQPDYYLVFAGPESPATSSRGKNRPLVITNVFLFETKVLYNYLKERKIRMGIATSVKKSNWLAAEIFPNQVNKELLLTDEQKQMLQLFNFQN